MPKDGFFMPFIAIVRERGKCGMNAFFETRDDALTCVVSEGLTFPMHLHPQLELFFVLSGETKEADLADSAVQPTFVLGSVADYLSILQE